MASPEGNYGQRGERREIPDFVNIAVLVSNKGTGSNLRAILDAEDRNEVRSKVRLVFADTEEAAGIRIAQERKIPSEVLPYKYKRSSGLTRDEYRDQYSGEAGQILNYYGIRFAVSAGFNRILTARFFEVFKGLAANIHPGALPNEDGSPFLFPDGTEAPWNQGMMTDDAVANFLPLKYATSTIHIMTTQPDLGPVLGRPVIPTEPGDTVESLYARLKAAESLAMLEVLKNPPLKNI